MSLPEKYVNPEGFSVATQEVYAHDGGGYSTLVIQSNADRDLHRCQVSASADLAAEDPQVVVDLKRWIYSLWRAPSGRRYIVHSNNVLQGETDEGFATVAEGPVPLTAVLGGSEDEIYVLGVNGYVGRLAGDGLVDMPVGQSNAIHHLAFAPDGTLYAVGEMGGLFCRCGEAWEVIGLGLQVELNHALALDADDVLLCGSEGFCGRYTGGKLERYETPDAWSYHAIARFQGDTFFGAGLRGVARLEGDKVEPFKDIAYAFHLASSDAFLFTSGLNRIGRYDGNGWLKRDYL